MGRIVRLLIGGTVACCLAWSAAVFAAPVKAVLDRPALKLRIPTDCVLTDVARAGSRLVAVGERGVILYSDDTGKTWHQATVPVSVTLTAAYFPTPQQGWAVGHSGVVLHTMDGGKTWTKQFDGIRAAKMAFENAEAYANRVGPDTEMAKAMVTNAKFMVSDGPDKPFLALHFRNDQDGIIIGSYGLIFRTRDGGATWECLMDRLENPDGLNLYNLRVVGDTIYIVGEQGLFFVSNDNGKTFKRENTPYPGTYFDLETTPSGGVVIVGLRGHAFWSTDQGATFHPTNVSVDVSFSAAARLPDGTLVFANQAGQILESRDQGHSIELVDTPRLDVISSILPVGRNTLMTAGYSGPVRVQLPSSGSDERGRQQ